MRNCIGYDGDLYFTELRDCEAEFWEVLLEGQTCGLIRLSTTSREIEEAFGPENDPLALPSATLLLIQRKLRSSGHDINDWNDKGAFHLFAKHPSLERNTFTADGRKFHVWTHGNELIFKEKSKGWSRIVLGDEWYDDTEFVTKHGEMSEGKFSRLLTKPSDLRDFLDKWDPTASPQSQVNTLEGDDDERIAPRRARRRRRP